VPEEATVRFPRSVLPLVALLTLASPLLAGPPWIAIEYPVNPFDASTRGAFLLVHAFHHGTPIGLPVTGTAEGLVGGERRSVPLKLEPTARTGVYALRNQWGERGEWTLVLTVSQGRDAAAQALVQVSGTRILAVEVPTRPGRDGNREMTLPRQVTQGEIEASLRGRSGAR
jgi:hypothetical protein